MKCPKCNFENPEDFQFCGKCGKELGPAVKKQEAVPSTGGERKHVTVLFSDLTGYTAMSGKLDPEEVKEITSQIFGQISKIVAKYDGFIEKYVGDAVMAIFGIPLSHEDDPIRAVKATREIHDLVDVLSPEIETRIGQPISMHSGINTGLVVTGEVDIDRGTHGVAGETINVASRLSSLAKPGEILIDADTRLQAEGYFLFEFLGPKTVKGKADPLQVHKLISQRDKPVTIHRLSGLRANLVGRKAELAELFKAVGNLREGRGGIFSICGPAGTGKSRLVEELKAALDLEETQWIEGHAYAYSQNIPYFPLIDLISGTLHIEENDPPEMVREKVESGIEFLVGKREDIIPYVGSLYSLSYPEAEDVSPEFWKSRLHAAVATILSSLSKKAPTIFFLEDLHWADPSFIELLRQVCIEIREPMIVLCVYRPTFSLFNSHQQSGVGTLYHEIQLQDLSLSDAQEMLESLLDTRDIPSDLKRLVQSKAEGNPFYLEEMVNSLIDSGSLVRSDGLWKIQKPITESDISSSINGLISGRLDRLEKDTKRVLQEASVIGRAFFYDILKRVSELKSHIDQRLSNLEQLDLIRTRSFQPDLEYIFKHALTQEVVYNGLLKKERQEIHEQIGLVMEVVFKERLPEFYETLAFHFRRGRSVLKAADYLIRSGEKSLRRYAVEESHQYFEEAFELLSNRPARTEDEDTLLVELLIKWSLVYYYRGDFREQINLLSAHRDIAESLGDRAKLGMFYAWYGFALFNRAMLKDSYKYLCRALEIGEEIEDRQVMAYACTWLSWTCAELGALDEAISFGERAQKICENIPSDHYLFFKSWGGIGFALFFKGLGKRCLEIGRFVLDYGREHSNARSTVMGHYVMGLGYFADGNLPAAIESYINAMKAAQDPFYSILPGVFLGTTYALNGQFEEAEEVLREVSTYSGDRGCESLGTVSQATLGLVSMAKGKMGNGLKMIEESLRTCHENGRRFVYASLEQALGEAYLQIVDKSVTVSFSVMAKNIGFILKNVPSAPKKAAEHFNKAIMVAEEIGARGVEGQAYLDLGRLHMAKGRVDKARDSLSKAIRIFEECELDTYLRKAREDQASLG